MASYSQREPGDCCIFQTPSTMLSHHVTSIYHRPSGAEAQALLPKSLPTKPPLWQPLSPKLRRPLSPPPSTALPSSRAIERHPHSRRPANDDAGRPSKRRTASQKLPKSILYGTLPVNAQPLAEETPSRCDDEDFEQPLNRDDCLDLPHGLPDQIPWTDIQDVEAAGRAKRVSR